MRSGPSQPLPDIVCQRSCFTWCRQNKEQTTFLQELTAFLCAKGRPKGCNDPVLVENMGSDNLWAFFTWSAPWLRPSPGLSSSLRVQKPWPACLELRLGQSAGRAQLSLSGPAEPLRSSTSHCRWSCVAVPQLRWSGPCRHMTQARTSN